MCYNYALPRGPLRRVDSNCRLPFKLAFIVQRYDSLSAHDLEVTNCLLLMCEKSSLMMCYYISQTTRMLLEIGLTLRTTKHLKCQLVLHTIVTAYI